MNNTTLFLTIIGMGLITFGIRLSFIALSECIQLPRLIQRGLHYVPPAVLSAIIFPEIFMPNGQLDISMGNPYLFAGGIAALIAWFSKNVFLTIGIGMIIVWLWFWSGLI